MIIEEATLDALNASLFERSKYSFRQLSKGVEVFDNNEPFCTP